MYALTANILASVANHDANYEIANQIIEVNIKTEKPRLIVFILVCWQNNTCLA